MSKREREVFELMAKGWGDRRIADYLCIVVPTVRFHRSKVIRKTGARSSRALLAQLLLRD